MPAIASATSCIRSSVGRILPFESRSVMPRNSRRVLRLAGARGGFGGAARETLQRHVHRVRGDTGALARVAQALEGLDSDA